MSTLAADKTHLFFPIYPGIRIVGYKGDDKYFILTQDGVDRTALFPEACEALEKLPSGTLVDGIMVQFSDLPGHVRPAATHRLEMTDMEKVYDEVAKNPLTFVVIDLLAISNKMLHSYPLEQRVDFLHTLPLRITEVFNEPNDLFGYGVIAKDLTSKYEFGRRTERWLKCEDM